MSDFDRIVAKKIVGAGSEEEISFVAKVVESARLGSLCIPGKYKEENGPLISSHGNVYLQKNWVIETHLIEKTKKLRAQKIPDWLDLSLISKKIEEMEGLFPSQKSAILKSCQNTLSVICGGPGTGKTYTASKLIQLLSSHLKNKKRLRLVLTAPTGKAAMHLYTTMQKQKIPNIDIEKGTLHRILKLHSNSPPFFEECFLDADVVIVDESSMVDVYLMSYLLSAIGPDTLLIFIGDPFQLPPVDSGSIFHELAAMFGSHLDVCVRTSDPTLQMLAESVKKGKIDPFIDLVEKEMSPFYEWINPLVSESMPDPGVAYEWYTRARIINPIRKGPFGIDAINLAIYERLCATNRYIAAPIIVTANDPWSDLYNGTNGVLIGKNKKIAYFPDPDTGVMKSYPNPPPYELAFCLSIHKAQGSEFKEIYALFPDGCENFGKEGLYTAITRAKNSLKMCGNIETLAKMIQTSVQTVSGFLKRFTPQ